jgi:hypothetical protein
LENRSATKTSEKKNEQIEKKMDKTLVQENIRDRQAEAELESWEEREGTHTRSHRKLFSSTGDGGEDES